MEDALFAELLGMGFDAEQVQSCYEAFSVTPEAINLQRATEWLLDQASRGGGGTRPSSSKPTRNTLVLTPPTGSTHQHSAAVHVPDIQKPISSSRDLNVLSGEEPLTSRYNLGSGHARGKERFAQKEREEAVRKARERRREDFQAEKRVRQQIQEDRRIFEERTAHKTTPTSESPLPRGSGVLPAQTTPTQSAPPPPVQTTPSNQTTPTQSSLATPTLPPQTSSASIRTSCRIQVRLPNGRVLRREFPSSALLSEVIDFVKSSDAKYSSAGITLVQPFPRHEYKPEENQVSLLTLGLCPTASLVVVIAAANQGGGVASHTPKSDPEPMEVEASAKVEDQDDAMSQSDGNESGSDSNDVQDPNQPVPPLNIQRQLGGRGRLIQGQGHAGGGHGHHGGRQRIGGVHGFGRGAMGVGHGMGIPNPFFGGDDDTFGGQGHRLGGKDSTSKAPSQAVAVVQREGVALSSGPSPVLISSPVPLEVLCTRVLVSQSSKYGMPSCAGLPPVLAQKLMAALKQDKRLNSKTLMAFYKCPVGTVNLDNYLYATNELLANLSHFPGLQRLSLCSCPIITDRAMADMLPYLSSLTCLKLNGCSQLSQAMFSAIRGCRGLEVLELSEVKVSDDGLRILLYYPLQHLKELDLSSTEVTVKALELLPEGAPLLERLNVEHTRVSSYSPLPHLKHLCSLNLARCPAPASPDALGVLASCHALQTLNLFSMPLEGGWLTRLKGLCIKSLKLPDRNLCFNDAMETVAEFPLLSLDLSDYLHIDDVGVSCLTSMTSLTSLSLSRTNLTDAGMPFLAGLESLRELCLDNTFITDAGMTHIAGLVGIEVLSLADTGVTSEFIVEGVLKNFRLLTKLNLCRTLVCDRGMAVLCLPSLTMLNLDWTCVTEQTTIQTLRDNGCYVLETLRNRNIGRELPSAYRSYHAPERSQGSQRRRPRDQAEHEEEEEDLMM